MGRSPSNILHALLHLSFYRMAFGMSAQIKADGWCLNPEPANTPMSTLYTNRTISNLAADINTAEYAKFLISDNYAIEQAQLTARFIRGDISEKVFCQMAIDNLEVYADSYDDEKEAGRI